MSQTDLFKMADEEWADGLSLWEAARTSEGLKRFRNLLLNRLPKLDAPACMLSLPREPESGSTKEVEDQLDAVLCAYVAAHWWNWGLAGSTVLRRLQDRIYHCFEFEAVTSLALTSRRLRHGAGASYRAALNRFSRFLSSSNALAWAGKHT